MAITKKKVSWKSALNSLRFIPRFFQGIYSTHPALFLSNVIFRLASSVIPVLMLWVGKLIIDEVILQAAAEGQNLSRVWFLLGTELGLAILSNILSRGISLSDGLLGDLYSNLSSVELIRKSASVQLSQLEDATFYDKLERARRQTKQRVGLMSDIMSQFQDAITVISLIAGLVIFQPLLILLLIVAIIPSFINEFHFSRSSYSLVRSWTPQRRELDYLRYIGASDVTAKEIKLFNLSEFIASRFGKLADQYYRENRMLSIRRAGWGSIFQVTGDVAYYAAYVVIIIRTVGGLLTIGDLTFLSGSFRRLRGQLQAIFSRLNRITESALYLQDYFDFLDLHKVDQEDDESLVEAPGELTSGIRFENVSFRYPGSDTYVLKNLSFTLHPGEKLALVGENGAGKTTLIKLLLRMYRPTEGVIRLNGSDIWTMTPTSYQRLFGVIFQDFVRYYFTARENIAVGKIEEEENLAVIRHAAEKSLASEVIETLPQGYDQPLGKRFHDGKDLSGGQWQKMALARAYMKDAEIVVLDEPTSSLDARAEYEAFQRFIGLTEGKAAVLISHRFNTVRLADTILVLKDGSVYEMGSHEQLLEKGGLYAELFDFQAIGYR
jgi:ATP-binding cassette subfamily B protein